MTTKKIIFLGPAWPYRGGIATIIETLARVFSVRGADVSVMTFSRQYPERLFPGRSQYRDGEAPEGLDICRCIDTMNPFNWLRVGRRIRREAPDMVVLKYWTPFMAPCFGTIARVARRNGHTKFIVQLDNVVPHERRWFDGPLTRWFTGAMDGFVYMSGEVGRDLLAFDKVKPRIYSPHPMFDHFGGRVPREEAAARSDLQADCAYVMFFGLVREYKGLDMLLEAWALLKREGLIVATSENGGQSLPGSGSLPRRAKLLVAGEFYDDVRPYLRQIERLGLQDDVVLHARFVPDDEVALYFSVADLLVLPYRSATQSGVTQIAYHFEVPMVVTDVGGLPEIVPDGVTGYVCAPEVEAIAAAIGRFFEPGNTERLHEGFAEQKKRFSWAAAADAIENVYEATLLHI